MGISDHEKFTYLKGEETKFIRGGDEELGAWPHILLFSCPKKLFFIEVASLARGEMDLIRLFSFMRDKLLVPYSLSIDDE